MTDTKTILVTGATDGIGKETALELARRGHRVLVRGRNEGRLIDVEAAVAEIAQQHGPAATPMRFQADFSALSDVRGLAAQVQSAVGSLDVLLNNAGVYMNDRRESVDGYEMTFAVNHLAPFLLTNLLLPTLRAAKHARVVTVASVAHRRGGIQWDDLQLFGWDDYRAYAQSKLANILFSNALARRVRDDGITSNSLHPGVVTTKLLLAGFNVTGRSLAEGAATSVYCAVSPEVADTTGAYFRNVGLYEPHPAALDVDAQERLWQLSEEMTSA